jgi:DNA polymerase III epsilon subunit-like protein
MADPFHYHRLDLLTLAWDRLPPGAFLSLKKVCERLDIPPEPDLHRALAGALSAFKVLKKLK